jgi:CelD/BcsL family acetyltransferase involved in cellulose biosynthesis
VFVEAWLVSADGIIMTQRCPNTMNHPDWMRAISAHISGANFVQVPATGLPRLTTVLAKHSIPLRHFETWVTPLFNAGVPSAATQPTSSDVLALFEAAESPVLFRNLPVDHPVTESLLQTAPQVKVLKRWQRAGLNLHGTFENWLQTNFDQKRRKELKRLRARLSEQGKLESISLQPNDDITPFLQDFLKLEAESWKGKRGTAIANSPQAAKALEAGLLAMHKAGRLKFWQIKFNAETIATMFALTDAGEVSLGKIAHAGSFAKYSPGVLLILDTTADLLADGTFTRADSNAIPGHPMIDRIWRDRIECVDVLLAGPSTPNPVFQCLATWIGIKSASRSFVKHVLARTLGYRIS